MPRRAVELLDVDDIQTNLKIKRVGRKIIVFNSTASTNNAALRYIANKNSDGLCIFAEEQTAGKGRRGNKWFSRRSESILCSIILFEKNLSAEMLSLTCAVAVAEAIGTPAKIKWPNDIIMNDKKVAGILLESVADRNTNIYIIGIGINCHQSRDSFPAEFSSKATSIDMETNTICDRVALAKRLLCSLDSWLDAAENDNKKVIDSWRKLSIQLGHRVLLSFNRKNFSGNCIGIDPEKGLILQLDTGGVRMFDAAHTTIIKR